MSARSVSTKTVKFETKWDRARKMWNRAMKDRNNDAMACIEFFTGQALSAKKAAKAQPNSNFAIRAEWMSNAATYGLNLAFGIDKAAK